MSQQGFGGGTSHDACAQHYCDAACQVVAKGAAGHGDTPRTRRTMSATTTDPTASSGEAGPRPVLVPGLADVPVAESAVSFIDGKRARLEYRGIAVETLARESCFEETCWLLVKGTLPTQRELADFDDQLRHHRDDRRLHGLHSGRFTHERKHFRGCIAKCRFFFSFSIAFLGGAIKIE